MRLKDNRDLQKFLQDCQEVGVASIISTVTPDFLLTKSFVFVLSCLCGSMRRCSQLRT